MHLKLFVRLLQMLCQEKDRFLIVTDGDRQYYITDCFLDDKNPYLYLEIEKAQ